MPYYSGTASSFIDLRTALVDACQLHGWVWDSSNLILSKGDLFYKIDYQANANNLPESLVFMSGTGVSGGVLTNVSTVTPRMGRERHNAYDPTWPMSYSIHIFTAPDEVYFVARHSVDRFYWAAFGQSNTPGLSGTGAYLSANFCKYDASTYGGGTDYSRIYTFSLTVNSLSAGSGPSYYTYTYSSGMFFANTVGPYSTVTSTFGLYKQDTIHTGLMSTYGGWNGTPNETAATSPGMCSAMKYLQELLWNQPNAWNNEAILLPINIYENITTTTVALVHTAKHARYVRVDYYEPEQVITLGPDKWKIYPFIKKNAQFPASTKGTGNAENHTGCLGWAIRYDGS